MLDDDPNGKWAHICVDTQSLFAKETDWHAPWLKRVLPAVEALAARTARRTIFTRFIPPETPEDAHGAWRGYYKRWPRMVRRHLSPELLNLVPSLAQFVPPALVFDKTVYSPWLSGKLHDALRARDVSTLVVSGGEDELTARLAALAQRTDELILTLDVVEDADAELEVLLRAAGAVERSLSR